jgi:two-component system cell cycle response regulator DivK
MRADAAKVLYIEDSFDSRLLVRRILNAEGYQVLEAENAEQGLAMARGASPDLIMIDINMPEMDGLTLTSMMKADSELSHIPVVAITANVMRGDRERTLAAGCDGYIQKPIDIEDFPQVVAQYLQHSR